MAIDLNADVGKIIKDFLKGKKDNASKGDSGDSKNIQLYKDAIMKVVIILCITVCIVYGISIFSSNPVKRGESEFTDNEKLNHALTKLENDISSSREIFSNNKKEVKEILPEFSSLGDSKNLFKLVSNLATNNSLVIKNISKGVTNKINNPTRYIQSTVFLEIEGFYSNYINFKQQLAKNKSILRIDSEKIKLKKDKFGERSLSINIALSDFSVNKEGYEELLNKDL